MKPIAKVALSGVICALSMVFMLLTVIPGMEMGLPALAGTVLVVLVIELGAKWGFLGYLTVGILSLLVAPSFEARILFAVFFGYYPVLKALLERMRSRVLCWCVKLALFNIVMVTTYWVLLRFTTVVEAGDFTVFGVFLPGVLLLIGNVVFVVYDIALTGVVTTYIRVLQPRLQQLWRF